MSDGLNVLSLFDGMSCGRVALERAGIPVNQYFASEIDKYAMQISKKNYPEIIQMGDVKHVHDLALPNIDLLLGGSPCQGFSFAGKQLAFDDPRSALFFEFVRLLKEVKPRYFLLENVRMKKEHQAVITEALGVEPININSNLVSAQNRNRFYWTNIPNVTQPDDKGMVFQSVLEKDSARVDKAYALTASYHKKGAEATRQRNFKKSQRPIAWLDDKNTRWLTPIECEHLQTLPDNYTEGISNTQRYKMVGNGWTIDVIVHILKNLIDKET